MTQTNRLTCHQMELGILDERYAIRLANNRHSISIDLRPPSTKIQPKSTMLWFYSYLRHHNKAFETIWPNDPIIWTIPLIDETCVPGQLGYRLIQMSFD